VVNATHSEGQNFLRRFAPNDGQRPKAAGGGGIWQPKVGGPGKVPDHFFEPSSGRLIGYRPLIGWLSGREHLQVRFIRTLIQKERSFPEASSAVSCSCRRGSPGTAPAGHSMLGFMNGGYVRLSSTPAPSKSTNRTS
jgi:hypothetical protein